MAVRIKPLDGAQRDGFEEGRGAVTRGKDGKTRIEMASDSGAEGSASATSKAPTMKAFAPDAVFLTSASQSEVYEGFAREIVTGVLSGVNGCLTAYGQTGSGKTHTMLGDTDPDNVVEHGVIPRALETIFRGLEAKRLECGRRGEKMTAIVRASYVEVYQEQVFDLLNKEGSSSASASASAWAGTSTGQGGKAAAAPGGRRLDIRGDDSTGWFLDGVTEIELEDPASAMVVLQEGFEARRTASTAMNSRSSRSHAILTLAVAVRTVIPSAGPDSVERVHEQEALLDVVDLAGSERQRDTGAEGSALKEAGKINNSLSHLAEVIKTLADNSMVKHSKAARPVPWRNSKLTMLLRRSLAGNSRTAMIFTITPATEYWGESVNTLHFADRARKLKTEPSTNERTVLSGGTGQQVAQLQKENSALKAALAQMQAALQAGGQYVPSTDLMLLQRNAGASSNTGALSTGAAAWSALFECMVKGELESELPARLQSLAAQCAMGAEHLHAGSSGLAHLVADGIVHRTTLQALKAQGDSAGTAAGLAALHDGVYAVLTGGMGAGTGRQQGGRSPKLQRRAGDEDAGSALQRAEQEDEDQENGLNSSGVSGSSSRFEDENYPTRVPASSSSSAPSSHNPIVGAVQAALGIGGAGEPCAVLSQAKAALADVTAALSEGSACASALCVEARTVCARVRGLLDGSTGSAASRQRGAGSGKTGGGKGTAPAMLAPAVPANIAVGALLRGGSAPSSSSAAGGVLLPVGNVGDPGSGRYGCGEAEDADMGNEVQLGRTGSTGGLSSRLSEAPKDRFHEMFGKGAQAVASMAQPHVVSLKPQEISHRAAEQIVRPRGLSMATQSSVTASKHESLGGPGTGLGLSGMTGGGSGEPLPEEQPMEEGDQPLPPMAAAHMEEGEVPEQMGVPRTESQYSLGAADMVMSSSQAGEEGEEEEEGVQAGRMSGVSRAGSEFSVGTSVSEVLQHNNLIGGTRTFANTATAALSVPSASPTPTPGAAEEAATGNKGKKGKVPAASPPAASIKPSIDAYVKAPVISSAPIRGLKNLISVADVPPPAPAPVPEAPTAVAAPINLLPAKAAPAAGKAGRSESVSKTAVGRSASNSSRAMPPPPAPPTVTKVVPGPVPGDRMAQRAESRARRAAAAAAPAPALPVREPEPAPAAPAHAPQAQPAVGLRRLIKTTEQPARR